MDEEQQRQRADLISRLFALITMKLEDAAGIAADCQGRRPFGELHVPAKKLDVLISDVATVLAGTAALLGYDH